MLAEKWLELSNIIFRRIFQNRAKIEMRVLVSIKYNFISQKTVLKENDSFSGWGAETKACSMLKDAV